VAASLHTGSATAGDGQFWACDTTTAAFTITLPSAPSAGTQFAAKIIAQGTTLTGGIEVGNAVTIDTGVSTDRFNTSNGGQSLTLSLLNQGVTMQYLPGTGGANSVWYVLDDDLPLSGLDERYGVTVSSATWSSSTATVSVATAAVWNIALGDADTTVTFTAATYPATTAQQMTMYLSQPASGTTDYGVTWPSSVQWFGGAAPTIAIGPSALTAVAFETYNGGITWYGSLLSGYNTPDWLNVKTYGATGNGSTDDTSAIQSAINAAIALNTSQGNNEPQLTATLYFPAGNYLINTGPLTVTGPLRMTGDWNSKIFSNSCALINFDFDYVEGVEIDHLTLDATGGHIFENSQLKFSWFHHLYLVQRSAAYGIWSTTGSSSQLQNTTFTDIRFFVYGDPTTGLRTVPGWEISSSAGSDYIAEVWFENIQAFNIPTTTNPPQFDTSQYLFHMACTSETTFEYVSAITFSNCSWHQCYGGVFHGESVAHVTFSSNSVYDVYYNRDSSGQGLSNDLYHVDTATDGSPSRGIQWVNCMRSQGISPTSNSAGDIYTASGTSEVLIMGYTPSFYSASWDGQFSLNSATRVTLVANAIGTTVTGAASDTLNLDTRPLAIGSGGTGASSLGSSPGQVLLGNGTSAISTVSGVGTATYVLTSDGNAGPPYWSSGGGGGGSGGGLDYVSYTYAGGV
jgi:Pectate lyase superfamily protein